MSYSGGEWVRGRRGDFASGRQGEWEMGRLGDEATGRLGDEAEVLKFPSWESLSRLSGRPGVGFTGISQR